MLIAAACPECSNRFDDDIACRGGAGWRGQEIGDEAGIVAFIDIPADAIAGRGWKVMSSLSQPTSPA